MEKHDLEITPKPKNVGHALKENKQVIEEPGEQKRDEHTPRRLFRGIVPDAKPEKDLVFLGRIQSLQTVVKSELAALWAYAYVDGCLESQVQLSDRLQPPSMDLETANLDKVWKTQGWLYETAPLAVLDAGGSWNETWRKSRSWLDKLYCNPRVAGEYKGMIEE
ncbi:MAG: hypothetical protein Q9171_000654 [Xanthocarpia ochracea]